MKNIFLLFAALFACVSAWAQTTVTGVVTSAADNEPLIGATVLVKGTAKFHGQHEISRLPSAPIQTRYMRLMRERRVNKR